MIPLKLDLLAQTGHFLEGSRIGKSDRGLVGERPEPLELLLIDVGPTEYGEDAQGLALEDQRLTGKCHDSFGTGPLRTGNRRIPSQVFCDEHWRPAPADTANLPHVQRDPGAVSGQSGQTCGAAAHWPPAPISAGAVDGPPGARPQVQALPLVWALGSHGTG